MSASKLELYERLVRTIPGLKRKGKTMPYTSLNGHMFSFLSKDGVVGLRLPQEDRDAFLKKYKTRLSEQYGAVLQEYVDVPTSLLAKTAELGRHFAASYAYVGSLKPKATAKKKPSTTATKKALGKRVVRKIAARRKTVAKKAAKRH